MQYRLYIHIAYTIMQIAPKVKFTLRIYEAKYRYVHLNEIFNLTYLSSIFIDVQDA